MRSAWESFHRRSRLLRPSRTPLPTRDLGLPITVGHATLAGKLALGHRDPFDRLLIAQALLEGLTLVSNEELFDQTAVSRLW